MTPASVPSRAATVLLAALAAMTLPDARAADGDDTLFLKNGRKAECRILDFMPDAIKISFRPAPDASPAERLIPLPDVDHVDLAPLPGETEALALAIRDGRADPLITFWVKRLPWLGRPRTNGGEIGLTYAELLSRVPTPDRLDRALKIYQQIETADWSPERRGRAQAGRLRLLLRQGDIATVRPQAEALLTQNGDPRVLIELHHVMAEAAAAALTQLEKDHPRWPDEDELVPQHAQLLNDAIDGYLFPHLFHGAEEDLAARGLWAAAQLSAAQKLPDQARGWAVDLTELYPSQPQTAAARAWLEKQPPPPAPTPPPGPKSSAENATGDPDSPDSDTPAAEPESTTEDDAAEPEPASKTTRKKPVRKKAVTPATDE
ncbi:MAG: hypothetical protein JWL81_525 [Verrucomicrobiales bacterium]|nr:hypothetical protein [Verrucomicrobiales bacterium]